MYSDMNSYMNDCDREELLSRSAMGDTVAQNKIVTDNIALVWSVVKKFSNRGYESDELFQVGCIGLIKAAKNFNQAYNVQFSTYAVPMIMGEIRRFIRDDNPIHVSRRLKELSYTVMKAKEQIENANNRDAKISEIAVFCDISEEEVTQAISAASPIESLYKTVNNDEASPLYLIDTVSVNKEDDNIDRIMMRMAYDTLEDKEKMIVSMRYMNGNTQAEVARKMGISQVQISRLEKKILLKMKQNIS